jgi:hypothetical protein
MVSQKLNGEGQLKIIELKQNIVKQFNPPFTMRKMIYLCCAILIFIFLFISLLSLVIHKETNNSVTSKLSVKQPVNVSPTTVPLNPFSGGGRYQTATYSIAYPKGSLNTTDTFTGGTTIIIQPSNYPNEPIFDVEAYTSAQNLRQKTALYLATGAKQTTITINNMKLLELRATYPIRTINSKPVRTPTQLRLAYLVKPNALYVFRMYYSSSVSIPAEEELFSQFIESFRLNSQ